MKKFFYVFSLTLWFFQSSFAQTEALPPVQEDPKFVNLDQIKDLGTFTEYFLLDEVRTLRINHETLRRDINQELNNRELRITDRALGYVANAVTYFSFFLTLALGMFAIFGWRTIKDLKNSAKSIVEKESEKLLDEFRTRLETIEKDLQNKGEEILQNQKELEKVQHINALWIQANRENDDRNKLDVLEQIRELEPENPEVLVAKAASYLRMDIPEQALDMCNAALEIASDHGSAIYNRACSYAQLGKQEEALQDLHYAIQLSEHYKETAKSDRDFEPLQKNKEFKELVR